jgi:hypothetical protein
MCLPDLGPVIFAFLAMPLVIAVTGPLVARLVRLTRPWLFAIPAIWALVVVFLALGPGGSFWPFNSAVSSAVIFLVPYALLAVYSGRRSPAAAIGGGDDRVSP